MSRVGKMPITIPANTKAKLENDFVVVNGPKGELKEKLNKIVKVEISDKEIKVSVDNPEDKKNKAIWGLFRNLINNMIMGVNNEFEKKLEINGVGFRAAISGRKLVLNVGFSHPVEFNLPDGINAQVAENVVSIKGINKQLVGETAAQVRRIKMPEPYKGKGIKYVDEVIRRKAGKTAGKGAK